VPASARVRSRWPPDPAVQTTAGVRAAMGISAVLLVVILAVVMVNIFGGDEDPTSHDHARGGGLDHHDRGPGGTRPPQRDRGRVPLGTRHWRRSPASIVPTSSTAIHPAKASTSSTGWSWSQGTGNPTITLKFAEQVSIRSILWSNIEDPDRFAQNYKVARISISDDTDIPLPDRPRERARPQVIPYVSLPTFELVIEITAEYGATDVGGNVFEDMAIAEIEVLGNPAGVGAAPTTPDTITGDTTETTAGG
jgi:hypothetical protein